MFFRVTFHLDGSGVYFDPHEPIHLDALLAWAMAPRHGVRDLQRNDVPADVPLPILQKHVGDMWVWRASALLPDGQLHESMQYWRKRFRQNRADLSDGSPNLTNGTYRDWQMPVPLILCSRLVAYASGGRKECRRLLREVRYVGKKRAHGHGKIIRIDLDEIEHDWSLGRDGYAMRWLPDDSGTRLVRPRPPYWHPIDRVRACEVGSPLPQAWA